MTGTRPSIVVVAAAYKYGTYVTDDALRVLDAIGDVRRIDVRAIDGARRREEFAAVAADADAVVVAPWNGQGLETVPGWLDAAPAARVVAGTFDYRFEALSGVDVFGSGRDLTVVDTSRTLAPTVAEFCLGMILNLLRDIPAGIGVVRDGGWTQEWTDLRGFVGGDLAGRSVGLAGFGVINRTLAGFLRPFGCAVSAFDPFVPADTMASAGVAAADSMVDLAARSEILVVGIPELPGTVGAVSREVIDALPAGALFVLPTRMAVVDQDALWNRVKAGELRAAVDVYAQEPPSPAAWFRTHPHVLPTPHMAGNTAQGHRRCFQLACEDTVAALTGGPVRYAMTVRDAAIYGGRYGRAEEGADAVAYHIGSGCLSLRGADPETVTFTDAFLDRCEHRDDRHRVLGRIVVRSGENGSAAAVVERRPGDEYVLDLAALRRHPELGDRASVVRKLARELWLARVAGEFHQLHASAVDNGHRVLVFVGDKRAGKTTLMLDAVMNHGYSLITNDGLLLCPADGTVTLAPLPTLVKIRNDTARRNQAWLEAAARKDPFNAGQFDVWLDHADAVDDNESSLYLTFAALGHPFREIDLADRDVTFVEVGFAPDDAVTVRPCEPGALARLLDEHRKRFVAQFAGTVGLTVADGATVTGLARRLAASAGHVRYAHRGTVAPLLDALETAAPAAPVVSGEPARDPDAAVAAAVAVARRLGVPARAPTVLRNGSNVTVLVEPGRLVAKVARTRRRIRRTEAWFAREVAVAAYLRSVSAPVTGPARSVPPGPHHDGGRLVSLWEWTDVSGEQAPPGTAGRMLRDLHGALAGYEPAGDTYDLCAECDTVLAVTPPGQFLAGERDLLAATAGGCFAAVREWTGPVRPLHGDPTIENLLRAGAGYVWCDFEDTYVGSVYWDLACLLAPAVVAEDHGFVERALDGYGVPAADPAVDAFVAARVMHSAIWSAYVNTPGPSRTRLRRLAWLETWRGRR